MAVQMIAMGVVVAMAMRRVVMVVMMVVRVIMWHWTTAFR